MVNKVRIGDNQNTSKIQLVFGKIKPSKIGYVITVVMTPKMTKLPIVKTMVGTNAESTFPTNNSFTVIGANNRLSNVPLSFSPTKLLSAIIIELITGIRRNMEPNK
jgi:hypothetical protein